MGVEYSITTDLVSDQSDLAREMPCFAQAGFRAIHWCQHWAGVPVFYDDDFVARMRDIAASNGLRIADIHGYSGPWKGLRYTDELFLALNQNRADFAGGVGAKVIVLHLPLREFESDQQRLEHSIKMVRAILPSCQGNGVLPAVENLKQTPEFLRALLDAFSPSELGFCYDSGHALITNQADLVERFADRLVATHLHDNDGVTDQHRLPGEGKADWAKIASVLRGSGYVGTWNLEVHAKVDMPLPDFCKMAYKTISSI